VVDLACTNFRCFVAYLSCVSKTCERHVFDKLDPMRRRSSIGSTGILALVLFKALSEIAFSHNRPTFGTAYF